MKNAVLVVECRYSWLNLAFSLALGFRGSFLSVLGGLSTCSTFPSLLEEGDSAKQDATEIYLRG